MISTAYGVAIVVVHHTRKLDADVPLDTVSGTMGLTGAADTTLVTARDTNGSTLYGRGRDIEEFETALSFDKTTGHWTMLGDATEVRLSPERKRIIETIRDIDVGGGVGRRPSQERPGLQKMS